MKFSIIAVFLCMKTIMDILRIAATIVAKSEPLFKILPDSIQKGSRGHYLYCETDPPHPHGEKLDDRKQRRVYYHRALMELKLGRFLKKSEDVDHKDGDPTNNALSNLVLRDHDDHAKHHSTHPDPDKRNDFWKKSPENKKGRPGR